MVFLLQTSFWQKLEHLDQWLFIRINSGMTNPFLDSLMPFMRNPITWAPLYLFLAVFVVLNFSYKGLWWSLLFVATAAATDLSGNIFKHTIARLRPCNDPGFSFHVRLLLDHCGTGYSFISNHAANHFGLAAFFYISMQPVLKKWAAIGFIWAALVLYSQVYVGVHYPLDVIAGALLGLILGTLTGKLFNKRFGFVIFDNQSTYSS